MGFTNILEACRHAGVAHLVFASTSSVYGGNTAMPFSEAQGVGHPLQFYAATKRANELMAHAYAHLYALPCTGLRFFTVYGPWGRPDMAPMIFAEAIMAGRPIRIFNEGRHSRDFTYVDDIVEGVIRASDRPALPDPDWDPADPDPATSSAPFRVYNIGNGSPVQLLDFIAALEAALGRQAIRELVPSQPGDVPDTWADTTRLERATGWRPATPLDGGGAALRGLVPRISSTRPWCRALTWRKYSTDVPKGSGNESRRPRAAFPRPRGAGAVARLGRRRRAGPATCASSSSTTARPRRSSAAVRRWPPRRTCRSRSRATRQNRGPALHPQPAARHGRRRLRRLDRRRRRLVSRASSSASSSSSAGCASPARTSSRVWVTCHYDWQWNGRRARLHHPGGATAASSRELMLGANGCAPISGRCSAPAASFRAVGRFDERAAAAAGSRLLRPLPAGRRPARGAARKREALCRYHKSDLGRDAAEIRRCNRLIFEKYRPSFEGYGPDFLDDHPLQRRDAVGALRQNNGDRLTRAYYLARAFARPPQARARLARRWLCPGRES